MTGKDDNKQSPNEQKKEKEIKNQLERLQTCPYCQNIVELIWVHSHYQCPKCKNVVVSCCGDS